MRIHQNIEKKFSSCDKSEFIKYDTDDKKKS